MNELTEREQRIWDHVFMAEFSRLFCYKPEEGARHAGDYADKAIEGLRQREASSDSNVLLARIATLCSGHSETALNAACQALFDLLEEGGAEPRWDDFKNATLYYRYFPRVWEDNWNRRHEGGG